MAGLHELRQTSLFRAAIIVPAAITLLFSLFNMTAPLDPDRLAASVQLGIVNLDEGQRFPPINMGDRLIGGMSERLPFSAIAIETEAEARARIETGGLTAVLIVPADFTATALGGEQVSYGLISAENLPMAEAQLAGQLPMMLDMALGGAIATVRLAIAEGRLPSIEPPVAGNVERLYPVERPAARMAPFIAVYTTWLAALVGAIILNRATAQASGRVAAVARTIVPLVASGIAALILAVIVVPTAGAQGGFVGLWLTAWVFSAALAWLFGGLLAVFTLVVLVVLIPVVFYQSVLSSAQVPVAAAPEWLANIGARVPFDHVGSVYRSVILGGPAGIDWALVAGIAAIGLVLIWMRALVGIR